MIFANEDEAVTHLNSVATDYRVIFGNPTGQRVLASLATFCKADDTTFDLDARVSLVQEGRRQVWLLINNYLGLTPHELLEVRRGRTIHPTQGDDDV